jgi:hypothetical protein
MSGLPIIFRAINVGFSEPTTIYQCVEVDGKWELREEITFKQSTVDMVVDYINDHAIAPHKPIVVPDDQPRVAHELKMRGIRVK